MKRFRLAYLIPLLCLSSCGESNPYGVYEFRLGKTDGSHVGVSAELSEEAPEGRDDYHKMVLSMDLGNEFSIKKVIDEYPEKYPIVEAIVELLDLDEILKDGNIPSFEAYFKQSDIVSDKYGNRLEVGSDVLTKLVKKIAEKAEVPLPDFDLPPDQLEKIFCAYLSKKSLTLQIPVSLADLIEQLTWYGYFLDVNLDQLDIKDLPSLISNVVLALINKGPKHLNPDLLPGPKGEERYGVHPVVDVKKNINQVAEMNQIFEFEFSHTPLFVGEDVVGSFVTKDFLGEDQKTYKAVYFKQAFDYTGTLESPIIGQIFAKDGTDFTEVHTIKFTVDENNKVKEITHNGESGKDEKYTVVTDEDKQIEISNFIQDPFVFRDFHDVKVGLSKI